MNKTTQAVVVGADCVTRLDVVDLPEMTPTRVLTETIFGGVSCGTESVCASGGASFMPPPFLSGYQAIGRVIEVGDHVSSLMVGDLVFTDGGGLWTMRNLVGGSHARYSVAEETQLIKLSAANPSLLTTSYAALAAVASESISRMRIEAGKVMLVFGLGMLGQFAGKLGQLSGLRVVGVNRSSWKRDAALTLGFDAACAPNATAIGEAESGLGLGPATLAVDTTGTQEIMDLALESLGSHGELALAGYYPGTYSMNWDICHQKQLSIHNPVGVGKQTPRIIELIESGQLNVEPLIRTTIKPREVTSFYGDLIANHSRFLGAAIDWRGPVKTHIAP